MAVKIPPIFLSYSRRETPFVNQLSGKLENAGVPLWLDYKSLVPAQPWAVQIEHGILNAEVCLLVVSAEALASKYVELEWKRALELGKRVVLVIFQAVPLPPELRGCEWVDLRVDFTGGVKRLLQLLQAPQPPTAPAPQAGVRAPWQVWAAIGLSILLIPVALFSAWTLVIPFLLCPLPWQIYRRRFNYSQVQFALLSLPLFVFTSGAFISGSYINATQGSIQDTLIVSMLLPALSLNFILLAFLSSKALDRWGRPEATRVRFANPLDPRLKEIRPVTFAIEHAGEDGRYAEAIGRELKKAGHQPAPEGLEAEASLVLISTHQKTTRFDPERQAVYPVLLQSVAEIDPVLARLQWIDFRNGLRNLHKLAQLLPDPQRLLKALAIAPVGSQTVYPPVVAFWLGYAVLSGVITGGSLLVMLFGFFGTITSQGLTLNLFFSVIASFMDVVFLELAIFWVVRALGGRRGGAAALYPILVIYLFQVLNVELISLRESINNSSLSLGLVVSIYNLGIFLGGGLLALLYALVRWQDLWRWLPRRPAGGLHPLERLFLLYTPSHPGALVLHLIFHFILLAAFLSLNLFDIGQNIDFFACFCTPVLLVAAGVNLWARYLGRKLP